MISKRFSLLFFLKKSREETPIIYLRVTVDQQRAELSTKRVCDPKRWNCQTGRMSGTKEDARTLNAYLDTLQPKVYEINRLLIEANEIVTAEAIKNKLTGISERPRLLMTIFKEHTSR